MIFGFYVDNSFYASPDFFDIVRVLIEVSSIVIFFTEMDKTEGDRSEISMPYTHYVC